MSAAINLGLVREQVDEQVWVRGGGKPSETLRAEQRKRHSAVMCRQQTQQSNQRGQQSAA